MKPIKLMLQNVRRSPYQALAAILIITQTFVVITIFTFIVFGSSKIINYFESRPQVTAFFKDSATQANVQALEQQLNATGKIASMHYVSKQEALSRYKSYNKNDPLLLDLVTADILPASLEVSTVHIEDLQSISSVLQGSSLVNNVIYQKDVISTLTSWTNALRKIGIALIVILGLDSVFIMLIIISIKISQKKEDIEIMRLIGATKWYIRAPFINEGIFYGVLGAVFGWVISVGGLLYATPFLQSFLGSIPLLPASPTFLAEVFGFELILAIILGFFSSYLAVLRYLK